MNIQSNKYYLKSKVFLGNNSKSKDYQTISLQNELKPKANVLIMERSKLKSLFEWM